MRATCCDLPGLEGSIPGLCHRRQSQIQSSPHPQTSLLVKSIISAVVVDFRDEVYASIAGLLEYRGLITHRAENASELAAKLASKSPELVLLSGTQADESSWLTSAKLRIIDASRPVWIYAPEPPSAIDEWLSMARTEDVIVYGGVLHRLLDQLRDRLSPGVTSVEVMGNVGQRRTVA